MASSDSEGHLRANKRIRRTSAGEDEAGGKRARGRPRVDTKDATAADRRRTQIRLAQRAYRQRKETTIASLKDQNTRLQDIIEQMNKSFLQFNDSALQSGLVQVNPALAHQLKEVTKEFVTLAKSAAEGREECEDGMDTMPDAAMDGQEPARPSEATQNHQVQHVPSMPPDIGWGYTLPAKEMPPNPPPNDQQRQHSIFRNGSATTDELGVVKYNSPHVTSGHVLDQGGRSWTNLRTEEENPSRPPLPFGLVEILSQQQYSAPGNQPAIFSVSVPTPGVSSPPMRLPKPPPHPSLSLRSPTPPRTRSLDETTFARRLARRSLETGVELLERANQRPVALNHVFRLSLPFMTLSELTERFRMLLSRGVNEDLNCWDAPFIHLGGAGTHYPRKDEQGNDVKVRNGWIIRRIGPMTPNVVRVENIADPSKSCELNIDLTGFEGEWFDAWDVEGYLEHEKGVRIDPKASFAEVIIDDDSEVSACGDDRGGFDYSRARGSVQSDTPSFDTGTDSTSSSTTPSHNGRRTNTNSIDNLFGLDSPFGSSIGLDFSNSFPPNDFAKFPDLSTSGLYDQPLGLDLAPGFNNPFNVIEQTRMPMLDYDQDMGAWGLDMLGAENLQVPPAKAKGKRSALVDVTKLVNTIIKHGVCLGRAPGFRRKDIDMAFEASLIISY